MNNYIPSGTSLFDVLSMIIPGGLIISFIAELANITVSYTTLLSLPFVFYILYFVLSYLVGLIWNVLMDWGFCKFRNNEFAIMYAKLYGEKCFSFRKTQDTFKKVQTSLKNIPDIKKRYYKAYYHIAKNSVGNVIIILETQVAFIRNMLFIVLGYGILLLFKNVIMFGMFNVSPSLFVGFSLIIAFLLLVIVMLARQNKIYCLIWEGEQYVQSHDEQR